MEQILQATFMAAPIPVIGYVRVSTWREEAISDEIQMDAIREAAARRGRYVARWIIDLDATGRNFKRRIMEAITAVETGEVTEIWVWKFSRFGRSRYGVAINLARVEHAGGVLESATEEVDATTATGRFARGMLFEVAAFESDRAGEQWTETHQLRRNAGLPATGGKRFGYQWFPRRLPDGQGGWTTQDERYQVLPPQAEFWLHGYRENTAGRMGFGKIADMLNNAGHFNTRGAPWSDTGIRAAFDSGFAAGLLFVHRRDVRCGDRGKCRRWKDHWTYLPAEHEAILVGDEWDAYRERRDSRPTIGWNVTPLFPLTGLTRCAFCRGAAVANTGGRAMVPGYSYRCRAMAQKRVKHDSIHVLRKTVEERVHEWLCEVRREIDDLASGKTAIPAQAPVTDVQQQRDRLAREVSALVASMDRATEGSIAADIDQITRDSYLRTRDKLARQVGEKQAALAKLNAEQQPKTSGPSPHREAVIGLLAEWDTLPVERKRDMLGALIRRVDLGRGTIDIVPVWAPPDPPEEPEEQSKTPCVSIQK